MKYIALIIMLSLMGWSWSLTTSKQNFGLEDHRDMEMQIEQIISGYIRQIRPTVSDISFQQLYTEIVQPAKEIRVHVRYKTVDAAGNTADETDTTQQTYQGVVFLKSNDGKTWTWAGEDMHSPSVEFKNGLRVTPHDHADADSEKEAGAH